MRKSARGGVRAGTTRALRAVGLAGALLAAGCDDRGAAPGPPAPLSIRGGVVVEPPELAIGETATVEVAVVTPPDHQLLPVEAPESVEGLWILAAEPARSERDPGRVVHRVRFLVRARATGEFAWPAQTAWVETPKGERVAVELAARPIRVIEVAREFPERSGPFSWRTPREPGRAGRFLLPALFGAAASLAALGLVLAVRRARSPRLQGSEEVPLAPLPRAGEAALARAEAQLETDPVAAAGAASAAIREYLAARSALPALASTTEELRILPAPLGLAQRWPEILELLAQLDAARFAAGGLASAAAREALRERLGAARALIDPGAIGPAR